MEEFAPSLDQWHAQLTMTNLLKAAIAVSVFKVPYEVAGRDKAGPGHKVVNLEKARASQLLSAC